MWGVTGMIAICAGAFHTPIQPCLKCFILQNAFGEGTAADITETDHQNFHGRKGNQFALLRRQAALGSGIRVSVSEDLAGILSGLIFPHNRTKGWRVLTGYSKIEIIKLNNYLTSILASNLDLLNQWIAPQHCCRLWQPVTFWRPLWISTNLCISLSIIFHNK